MVLFKTFLADSKLRLEQRKLLKLFIQTEQINEYVVLDTCDRLEIYYGNGPLSLAVLERLSRITAGIDSPIIGEKAIQGQVKSAYLAAIENQTINSALHLVFQQALRFAKRVRHETGLDRGSIGHGQIVVNLLKERQFKNLVIIGINDISKTILNYLADSPLSSTILANRNAKLAEELAQKHSIRSSPLSELSLVLQEVDCIISCTSAPHYLIRNNHFTLRDSSFSAKEKLVIIDLSAPPDTDPECLKRTEIEYFDLKAIEEISQSNQNERQTKASKAHKLLLDAINAWLTKQTDTVAKSRSPLGKMLEYSHEIY